MNDRRFKYFFPDKVQLRARGALGYSLCCLREKASISQEYACGVIGLRRATLSDWEHGRSVPRLDQLERYLSVYGVGLSRFIKVYLCAKEGGIHNVRF